MPIDPAISDTNSGINDQHGDEEEDILDCESDSEPEDRED